MEKYILVKENSSEHLHLHPQQRLGVRNTAHISMPSKLNSHQLCFCIAPALP